MTEVEGLFYIIKSNGFAELGKGRGTSYGNAVGSSLNKNPNFTIPSFVVISGHKYIVSSISEYAFGQQEWIVNLKIPKTIRSIGEGAFWKTKGLESVAFDCRIKLTRFPTKIFDFTKLKRLEIPETLKDFDFQSINYNTMLSEIIYCGKSLIPEQAITSNSNDLKIYVTTKYKEKLAGGIEPSLISSDKCSSFNCPRETIFYSNNQTMIFKMMLLIILIFEK